MAKYRKKSVVVKAIQFTRNQVEEVYEFAEGNLHSVMIPRCIDGVMKGLIDTLEGTMVATENDYIIKGVQGEFYPCKPDIFEMTYEKVNGENPEIMTKKTSLNVIVESLIEGAASFLMTCPSCDKPTISSQQVYIHDNIKREWYCRNCGQKLNNHNLLSANLGLPE